MSLYRSFLLTLLISSSAFALSNKLSIAAVPKSAPAASPAMTYQVAQIELPKDRLSTQGFLRDLGMMKSPLISIAHGFYQTNQLEKFELIVAKLDRFEQGTLLLRIAETFNWQDNGQEVEALVAQYFPRQQRGYLLEHVYYFWLVPKLLERNRVDEAAHLVRVKMAHIDVFYSFNSFKELINAYLRQNRLREVLETIKQFEALQSRWLANKQLVRRRDDWLNEIYEGLINYYLMKQQYRNAFKVVQLLKTPDINRDGEYLKPSTDQIKALLKVATACSEPCSNEGRQIRNQALKQVESLATQFQDVEYRVKYLAAAAMGYGKAGQKAKSDNLFAQALQLVPKITSRYPEGAARMRSQAIAEIASYQGGAGNLTQALKLTSQLSKEDRNRAALLLGIANLYARQGNQKRAVELYNQVIQEEGKDSWIVIKNYLANNQEPQAINLIRQIQEPDRRRWGLMALSEFYQERKNRTQALAFLNEAVALFSETLNNDKYVQENLLRIMLETVETYRELEDFGGAEQLLDRILSLANQITGAAANNRSNRPADTDLKSTVLYRVAAAYAQIGSLAKSLEIIPMIPDPKVQERAKLELVNGYLEAKAPDKALELARSIQQPEIQATALSHTAHYWIRNQKSEQALPLLDSAFSLMQSVNPPK